jgi:drug/metabolite transporter (DMT)-like permease
MYDDDEFSRPVDPATRASLLLVLGLAVFWGIFFVARKSNEHRLVHQLLPVGVVVTPIVAGLSLTLGVVALRRLHGKGFAQRGLAVVAVAASAGALFCWLVFMRYTGAIG